MASSYDKSGIWQKCGTPIWPRRTVDGKLTDNTLAQTWCRWNGVKWEYQQDEETLEQFLDRQW